MRKQINKKNSTKAERIMYEILKELHIEFKHRWIIKGREVDFLIGNNVIEINGHPQDRNKNHWLVELGYTPHHINNQELYNNRDSIKQKIKNGFN